MIEGTVKYEGSGDVYVAAYVDGVHTSGDFPDKLNYKFDYAECNNNAEINFDQVNWEANVSKVKTDKTKCNVYFTTRDQANLISNKIKYFAESDTVNLAYDDTIEDSNLRYIGANPSNYVTFNGELWRIIGSFKDIDDGTGKLEWRTKIIRNKSIGGKAWDAINNNDWNTSDIKDELNGSYYNGISIGSQGMIGTAKWAIGKASTPSQNALAFYNQERSGATWNGKIGLMYPSDYGYAVGGGSRVSCLNKNLYSYNTVECKNNDWLFINGAFQWTITANLSNSSEAFGVADTGYLHSVIHYGTYEARPTLYLSSNVALIGGSGTSTDPFQLSV